MLGSINQLWNNPVTPTLHLGRIYHFCLLWSERDMIIVLTVSVLSWTDDEGDEDDEVALFHRFLARFLMGSWHEWEIPLRRSTAWWQIPVLSFSSMRWKKTCYPSAKLVIHGFSWGGAKRTNRHNRVSPILRTNVAVRATGASTVSLIGERWHFPAQVRGSSGEIPSTAMIHPRINVGFQSSNIYIYMCVCRMSMDYIYITS